MKAHALSVVLAGAIDPIGAAVARRLLRRGARVLLVSRHAEALVELARELAAPDDRRYHLDALAADIGTAHGCHAVLDAALARNTNALVNVHGVEALAAPPATAPRAGDVASRDALAAALQVTRTLLPHLLSQPDARVLNIGPSFAGVAPADTPSWRARQDELHAASETLRRELAGGSVRVQFLGRRVNGAGQGARRGGSPPDEMADYVASVAVQMLLAGTRERFLGAFGGMRSRIDALIAALLDPAPDQGRA